MTETNAYYHHPGLDAARILDEALTAPDASSAWVVTAFNEPETDPETVSDLSAVACPTCGERARVMDSREAYLATGDEVIRRRRGCITCPARWNTFEIHEGTLERLRRGAADGD